ncbi:MAG: hypothetical protein PHQ86_06565 [Dehalococcoidales bacterium]|nr:hypothetical protein [Dehalococcoidales bacterium]
MGEGLANGFTTGLASLPPWVWTFILLAVVWLLHPWDSIKGIPTWAWIAVGVLAIWALISGK